WRPRDHNKRHVAIGEMNGSSVKMIGEVGAAAATLLPSRSEHEVIDDQLALIAEQLGEALLALARVEDIWLVHLDPRQSATLSAQPVACADIQLSGKPSNSGLSIGNMPAMGLPSTVAHQ